MSQLLDSIGERKYLTGGEEAAFLAEVHRMDDFAKRVFCVTMLYSGGRVTEVISLTPRNIDFSAGKVVFRTLKQRKKVRFRAVPMPSDLASMLAELIEQNQIGLDDRIWEFCRQTGLNIVKKAMTRIHVSGSRATTRGLRHTFATSNTEDGVKFSTLRTWLGHARMENTAIYLDFTGAEERAYAERRWEKLSLSQKALARNPDEY
ncbi:tyrosine-type recombinase/integrase [Cerasicoccus frondis]|uniref:tyrosine-type recombinase/integrase n=1 Tax=Cerasicoccus frondis TaxID=490090 RepID=UPI00285257EC|nr:site-specific integrase [Cerasicoccus frondis]